MTEIKTSEIFSSSMNLDEVPTHHILATLKKRCSVLQSPHKRILLLGPPGCGKGTQSEWLKNELGLVHLSTGDMLRAAVASRSEIGVRAEAIMQAGQLVPDEVVLAIVKEKLDVLERDPDFRGFILDGFPRTVAQAEGLQKILIAKGTELNAVFNFALDDALLMRRVCGRRVHLPSGRTYHLEFKPPREDGKDDVTGEPLTHRADDNEASFQTRLDLYKKTTAPLIEFYQRQGVLFRIDAGQPPNVVRRDIETLFSLGNNSASPSTPTITTTATTTAN